MHQPKIISSERQQILTFHFLSEEIEYFDNILVGNYNSPFQED